VHLAVRDRGAVVDAARARGCPVSADGSAVSLCGVAFRLG